MDFSTKFYKRMVILFLIFRNSPYKSSWKKFFENKVLVTTAN